jgi:Kdo2-lipid IVA lauroyltransferase/acyltransferase
VKKLIRQLYFYAGLLFSKIVLLMPYRAAVKAGGVLGSIAYHLVSEGRRDVEQHLAAAFPDWTASKVKETAKQVFVNMGKNLFELFSFPKLSGEKLFKVARIENVEALRKGLEKGKGVLIASAHCGNWEFIGATVARSGIPINAIARKIYIEGLNNLLVRMRNAVGEKVILRSGTSAAKDILRSLRSNETIGILIDQDTVVPSVFVDFFGRQAWTPTGLTTLALKTGAPVVLVLDLRMPDDTHKTICEGPLEIRKTDNHEADLVYNTQYITSLIEKHIRKYPDQWVWMHRRWKTKPEDVKKQ